MKYLQLSAGTSSFNFIVYLLACLLTISFFVFFNSCQNYVLTFVLGVEREQVATTTASLLLFDQILSLFLLGTWGSLSDRIGRRIVFCLGFGFMGTATVAYPFARNVYPDLLVMRLIFAVGAAASSGMVTAVLADYVCEKDKGKVSGAVGLMSGLGAVFGAFVLLALPSHIHQFESDLILCLKYAYLSIGTMALVFSVFVLFGLRVPEGGDVVSRFARWFRDPADLAYESITSPQQSQSEDGSNRVFDHEPGALDADAIEPARICPFSKRALSSSDPTNSDRIGCTMPGVLEHVSTKERPFYALVFEGFKLGWERPSLILAYLGGFLARGDSIIITLFLPIWINNIYLENGTCKAPTGRPTEFQDPLKLCDLAFKKTYSLSGIAQTLALVGAPVFGFASEKFDRTNMFLVASLLSFIGYFPLSFVKDPTDTWVVYLLMVLVGIGEIGLIVTSLSLAASNVPKEVRGSVAGCYSFFGGLGVLTLTTGGGALFNLWNNAPFFLVGTLSLLLFLSALVVKATRRIRI